MSSSESERVVIGRVSGLYGVRGWVKIHSFTEPRENILAYGRNTDDRQPRFIELIDTLLEQTGFRWITFLTSLPSDLNEEICERVLGTLRATHREAFVPENERDLAFADLEIPLPHGQCMMAPKVEARLLQELAIEPTDRVLEIGTGSGYLAACLARLAE